MGTSGPRSNREMMQERLAHTAEMMVRLRSSYRVEQHLCQRYGIKPRQAQMYMSKVRELRRQEATSVDVVNLRDDMRESLNMVAALALGKTVVVKNDDGSVVMNREVLPDGTTRESPAIRPAPDLQRALHAFKELIHIDGLAEPVKSEVKVDAEVAVMPDIKDLGKDAAKAVEDLLKTIAPNADVAKLAGEWFRFSGDEPSKKAG